MLEKLLEQLHREHGVIQIRALAKSLFKVSKQCEGDVGGYRSLVNLLFRKFIHALQLDDQA